MKKKILSALSILLIVCLVLPACGEVTAKKPLNEIYGEIAQKFELPQMLRLGEGDLMVFLGIDGGDCEQFEAYIPDNVVLADALLLFECSDAAAAARVKEKVDAFKAASAASMKGYIPSEYDKIESSAAVKKGNFVWLVISDDRAGIEEIINSNIK